MQTESTVTARRNARSLGLSVFNPDNSSDDDHPIIQQRKQPPSSKPFPTPGQTPAPHLPQLQQVQQQNLPYHQRQLSFQPAHSASSSTSSISIQTSSSAPHFNVSIGGAARQNTNTNTYSHQSSPTSRYASNNYVSSSSSRSSPAMDSTPPPITPASTLAPVTLGGDERPMEGLGLNVNESSPSTDNDYMSYQPARSLQPAGALLPHPDHNHNTRLPLTPPSPAPNQTSYEPRSSSSTERLIITATADAENHVIVDITGAKDASFIRERMFSKLRLPDEEHQHYSIYRTELGEAALGEPVTDDQLMIYCAEWADGKGTLKFLVQRKPDAPPIAPSFVAPPHLHSPPLPLSPAYARTNGRPSPQSVGGDGGSNPSTTSDRDRPPWDKISNGYEGDVDGRHQQQQLRVGRHQSPPPIDTTPARRRREPSASSSDYNYSPSSPSGSASNQVPQQQLPSSLGPGLNGVRRGTTPTPSFMVSGASTPSVPQHRRHESEAVAREREYALEASERMQENQQKEYDAQIRRLKVERERQRRQQQMHGGGGGSLGGGPGEGIPPVPPVPSVIKSHRSESMDAESPSRGWVLVNEVPRGERDFGPPSSTGAEVNVGSPRYPPRTSSFSREGGSGPTGWNPATPSHLASPPAESPRFSPSPQQVLPPSRPYPHSTGTSHSQLFSPTRSASGSTGSTTVVGSLTPTTPLQRSHPPLPPATKYPSSHPHAGSRSHALPPGASDPRMRNMEARAPPANPSSFYPSSIPTPYNNCQSGFGSPVPGTPSRLQQNGLSIASTGSSKTSPQDAGSPPSSRMLHSARSIPDLRPYSPSGRSNVSPAQLPVGRRTTALPSNLQNDSVSTYGLPRLPQSPNRLPPPSPSRPIISPSTLYNPGSGVRSPNTPEYGSSGIARSLGMVGASVGTPPSASLFSSGAFAEGPLSNRALRSRQSYDKLNALDRTQPPVREGNRFGYQGNNVTINTNLRENGQSGSRNGNRPQSDSEMGDSPLGRPSPVETTPALALSRLETRRPSAPTLITIPGAAPSSLERQTPLSATMSPLSPNSIGPYTANDGTMMQVPQAVVTPSSPMDDDENGPNGVGRQIGGYSFGRSVSGVSSPAISATSSQELTDEGSEGTLRAGDRAYWERFMGGSDNDADGENNGSGTLKQRLSGQTVVPQPPAVTGTAKRVSMRRAKARSIKAKSRDVSFEAGALAEEQSPSTQAAGTGDAEEEWEEYSDEEDDDDDRFWNVSATPTPAATPAITVGPAAKSSSRAEEDDGSGTMMPPSQNHGSSTLRPPPASRGPSLTLQIAPVVDDRSSPAEADRAAMPSSLSSSSLTPSASAITPGGESGVDRRASFKRDTWAFRPKAEDVYDNLQDFFPDYDLDKTFIDPMTGGVSPVGAESPPVQAPSPAKDSPVTSKLRYRKSIRIVAEERKKALDRINTGKEQSAGSRAANVARKRSTKLWGSRVEEVTPGQVKAGVMPTVPESPTGAAPVRPTIKWVKGELIGKGTYGKVFLALNATTGEMLAVKQVEMPQTTSDQDDQRQVNIVNAIKSEQETLERLDHSNIVQYLGFEQTKEYFSIFLEYVPGGSIGSCLRKQGKFDENVVRSFTGQILDGLAYLHQNKIIHRDVKADNILVDPSGTCKISDFGISKRSDEVYNNAAMTVMQGSLFWMAPEMLHNNKKGYNAKIDIWSLGCVFIEMFAGRRPWEQFDFMTVMYKVGNEKMAPPVPEDVTLSPEADDFRLQCFIEDPAERPTAEALKSHPWLILPRGWTFTGLH